MHALVNTHTHTHTCIVQPAAWCYCISYPNILKFKNSSSISIRIFCVNISILCGIWLFEPAHPVWNALPDCTVSHISKDSGSSLPHRKISLRKTLSWGSLWMRKSSSPFIITAHHLTGILMLLDGPSGGWYQLQKLTEFQVICLWLRSDCLAWSLLSFNIARGVWFYQTWPPVGSRLRTPFHRR